MKTVQEDSTENQKSKRFSLKFKIIAFLMSLAFIGQTLGSINSHTYSLNAYKYIYHCSCFGCYPTYILNM